MNSDYPQIAKIIPYLQSGDAIPHLEMLNALNEATGLIDDQRRREVASTFLAEAGRYLSSHDLMPFIKADLTDSEAKLRINERKALLGRLSDLLPAVFGLLAIRNEASINSALIQINDCCGDYHTIKAAEYSSKQRKRILNDIKAVVDLSRQLELTLQRVEHHIGSEFEGHDAACNRVSSADYPEVKFHDLQRLVGVLRFSSEVVLYKDSKGERAFYIGDNRARTHVVEYCYRMAVQFGAPKFATTPGSDFSVLCSLVFELATGEADASLAGAINKFSRSDLRRTIDDDEAISRYENSGHGMAEREADNFASIKSALASLEAEARFWRSMLLSREWAEFERVQISFRMLDALERRDEQENKHGPFLVWASQISAETGLAFRAMIEERARTTLELAERVGRRTREERS